MKKPCMNCKSTDYNKLVPLEIQGVLTTACDVCSPEEFTCSLTPQSGDAILSTGTLHATLDWSLKQPVVEAHTEFLQIPWWRRLKARLKALFRKITKRG